MKTKSIAFPLNYLFWPFGFVLLFALLFALLMMTIVFGDFNDSNLEWVLIFMNVISFIPAFIAFKSMRTGNRFGYFIQWVFILFATGFTLGNSRRMNVYYFTFMITLYAILSTELLLKRRNIR